MSTFSSTTLAGEYPSASMMRPQFGSPPFQLVFTSELFAVAHNHLGQFEADMVEPGLKSSEFRVGGPEFGVAGQPICQHEHSVVGAHIAIDSDAIETLGDGLRQRGLKRLRLNRRVGC